MICNNCKTDIKTRDDLFYDPKNKEDLCEICYSARFNIRVGKFRWGSV